jgi:hypothetical protein
MMKQDVSNMWATTQYQTQLVLSWNVKISFMPCWGVVLILCHVRHYGPNFGQTHVIGLVFGGLKKKTQNYP